ncbi:hypothetical protein ABZ461_23260 [Actinacidiphila glaucinigra]|uniref:hypothetical protein n=1 Tax=Actinacidiphila glaucinigra TaxID=235986 RepID=UPI0034017CBC
MKLYLGTALVLLASLVAVSGVAAITRGWVLPWNRRNVSRRRLYGWGQLVLAFALYWQALFGLVLSDPDARAWGTLTGSVILLAGIIVMGLAQFMSSSRQGSDTP